MRLNRFDVQLTRSAEKDIKDYKDLQKHVLSEIRQLEDDPRKGHPLTGSLRGVRSLEFSLVDGAHRAVYIVLEADQVCLVFLVGPHEGFYNRAKRKYEALQKARRRGQA